MSSDTIRQHVSEGFDFLHLVVQEANSLWSRISFALPLSLWSAHVIITVLPFPARLVTVETKMPSAGYGKSYIFESALVNLVTTRQKV